MTILLLETATQICSVAIEHDGAIIAERNSDEPNVHSSKLAVFINEILDQSGLKPNDLDAVCVSSGPGSYTGLRIGVSSAKGFCYALNIPLLAVPTLQNMASLYYTLHPDYDGLVCPMIDARRMECYTAIFNRNGEIVKETSADIIDEKTYKQWLDNNEITFIGDGADKTVSVLGGHPNAHHDLTFKINARGMADIAEKKLQEKENEDVAYFEPFYLKDFVAKKSVVHGLR